MADGGVASALGGPRGLSIRNLRATDVPAAAALLTEELGGRMQARRGELVDVLEGDGLLAISDSQPVGLITWQVEPAGRDDPAGRSDDGGREAEIRALAVRAAEGGRGVGRALLAAAEEALRTAGIRRAWLVTTNDNLVALALYQKAGWRLAELRAGAIDQLRRSIKPSIPEIGEHGIPLRDELELAKTL